MRWSSPVSSIGPSAGRSTLIGCEKLSRKAFLMELDPKYCDVIVKRWQAFTGKAATLEGDGRTFEQIAAERATAVEA